MYDKVTMIQSSLYPIIILLVNLHSEERTLAFKTMLTNSITHQDITQTAILQTTAEVCKAQALQQGRNFVQSAVWTVESLTEACSSPSSAKGFQQAIKTVCSSNAWVDFHHASDAEYHFDDEKFFGGWILIQNSVRAVKAAAKEKNYETARKLLGEALHPLQDFYSHSNWIELGNRFPYSNLIRPDRPIDNIAGEKRPTCRNCDGDACINNILEDINEEGKLTSGYFLSRPPEKCSHGGVADISSWFKGGINKDTQSSSHGNLHDDAATVAIAATRQLLEDIRGYLGDSNFLRLMGFSQTSVLCFVIDTTGSMGDDINEVRRVTSNITDSMKGTVAEYILVPFNDPDFGPLIRTTDPDEFKLQINALQPHDGGDTPELCLSGLRLALTSSPPQTKIFVFTDADAKDKELKSTVLALIESTKSVVNFMLTNGLAARRRRSEDSNRGQRQHYSTRISNPLNQVYEDLALASGGQAIEVTKATLPQATSIILDASTSALVTVFQIVRNPGKTEAFSFIVDSSLKNITIYITGNSLLFNITSPTGDSQTNEELSGKLGLVEHVGNFYTVRLTILDQVGLWNINISSLQAYTIKVHGQSDIDFLFNFVELSKDVHSGYSVLRGRPPANSNITLLLTVMGGDSVTLTEVSLVEASGSQTINGTLERVAVRDFLVTMNSVPAGEFVVRVFGERSSSRSSNSLFQRQSVTQNRASSVVITATTNEVWEPGKTLSIPFTVVYSGSDALFNINARNDRGFATVFPSTMSVGGGSIGNSTVNLTAPVATTSGTEVTLTIEAETSGKSDFNYAVLRLTVVSPITDVTSPVCEIISVNANCSSNCSLSSWELSANLTDGNGTGIVSVTLRQGLGTLNTSTPLGDGGVNVTLAFYSASCCSEVMELVAVDRAGNVGVCSRSIASSVSTTPNTSTSRTNSMSGASKGKTGKDPRLARRSPWPVSPHSRSRPLPTVKIRLIWVRTVLAAVAEFRRDEVPTKRDIEEGWTVIETS
ncbi:von Willebrand factor A domain-containing protein 7-like [Rhinichthys klamathensis goyatoka]|uniref:von Willebrand factor A domain-containing protein 7-like n=1 Tax=Rhinichthys klamathensis goyatoka TaxID=3034132 RepID=UPI0024B56118|nr:von Willebrand factor A domain-containing protein 7-like [Rhinichthys klamathensis goyatoka]